MELAVTFLFFLFLLPPLPPILHSYDALQREKESLEEALEAMQVQVLSVSEENGSKQLKMLQKIIRNLEVILMCTSSECELFCFHSKPGDKYSKSYTGYVYTGRSDAGEKQAPEICQ